MSSLAGAVVLVVGFVWVLTALKLPARAAEALEVGRTSFGQLRDADLSDDEKERALQRAAVRQFILFFQLALGGAAAVLLPAGAVWLMDLAGLLSFDAVVDVAASWQFLLGSTVAVLVGFRVLRRS